MFCLCMCALLKFIKVFCIVLYILMALLVHCFYRASSCSQPSSPWRLCAPTDRPDYCWRGRRRRQRRQQNVISGTPNAKRKKKKEKHVFSFFPSATHKEEKKTKRLRSISPIRNRLQIKLWKFSGSSVAFEVRRQKTGDRLFFGTLLFICPLPLISVCFFFIFLIRVVMMIW